MESAEERAYRSVINMIVFHQCPPGSPVVEKQVAEELGLSRTPVRNAMKRLVSDGLLDSSNNRGCFVPMLSRRDLDNLYSFRMLVECDCAKKAATRCNAIDIKRMKSLLEEEKAIFNDRKEEIYLVNEKIHLAIVAASQNEYFVKPVKQLIWRSQLYLFFFDSFYMGSAPENNEQSPDGSFKSCDEHEVLFEAIQSKDPVYAELVMREHITATYELLVQRKWH
ncbi:MAG: GntR family transcriptional regulator [bacterium]|nr:GntR family transcriptional regulator [bacterium]